MGMGTSLLLAACRGLNRVGNAMRDGGLGLAQFSAVVHLSVGRIYARKWPFISYGTQIRQVLHAACMGLTNY
jgi:hypothetical protein